MRFQFIFLILVILFASLPSNQAIRPIQSSPVNINDSYVINVTTFAVTEYNKQNTEAKLVFEKLLNGVIDTLNDGINYRLTLSANNGSTSNDYGAIVLEKPYEHLRNLTAFALVQHA